MKSNTWKWCWFGHVGIVILAVGLLGCSNEKPKGSVSGTVTFGGKPVTSGSVLFSDATTGTGATASLDTSGKYRIDSIPTGSYQVAITPPPAPAPHERQQQAMQRVPVPPKYQNSQTSGLTATVGEGTNEASFNF